MNFCSKNTLNIVTMIENLYEYLMALESNDRRVREVHETMYVQFNASIIILNNNSAVPIFIWARLVSSLVSDAPKVRKRRVRIFLDKIGHHPIPCSGI